MRVRRCSPFLYTHRNFTQIPTETSRKPPLKLHKNPHQIRRCVVSWQMFGMYPPPHLRKNTSERTMRAIVDGSPSRGGSASTYGLTFMACLLAPDDQVRTIPLVLIVFQEFLPKSKRDLKVWKGKRVRQMIAILGASVMMLWNFYFQQNLVSDAVLLRHACIAYMYYVRPSSTHALCDWQVRRRRGFCCLCCRVLLFATMSPCCGRGGRIRNAIWISSQCFWIRIVRVYITIYLRRIIFIHSLEYA